MNGLAMVVTSILMSVLATACGDTAADPGRPDQGNGLQTAAAIIEVAPAEAHLPAAGQTLELEVALRDARGRSMTGKLVSWKSLQPTVAKVDASGRVTGLAKGTALVQASVDGISDTARVMVDAGPAEAVSVTILPQLAAIETVGSTFDFAIELLNANGDQVGEHDVTWESLDPAIATVSSSGRVFALAKGVAHIVARTAQLTDTAEIRIGSTHQAASIQIVPEQTTLDGPGSTAPLSILLKDANGGMLPVSSITWQSNAPGIARVSSAGVVTGVSVGIAQITATHGALQAFAAVEVGGESQPVRVLIQPEVDTIASIGATVDLTATVLDAADNEVLSAALSWSSLDPGAAIVGPGRVAAVNKGVSRIVARHGALADTAMIWVTPAPQSATPASVTVVPGNDTIPSIGAKLHLTATVSDAQGQPIGGKIIDWQSVDPGIATVNDDGFVTAVAQGSARIVASHLTFADTALVHVAPAPDPEKNGGGSDAGYSVKIYPGVDTIPNIGGTLLFEGVVVDAAGNGVAGAEPTWSVLDESVLSLDAEGSARVTNGRALQQGTARIIATYEGVSDTATIAIAPGVIVATPSAVRVTPANDTIHVLGGTVQLTGHVLDTDGKILVGQTVKWSSLDPGVAAVSGGVVTGLSAGTARIRGSFGALADTAIVTVASALNVQPASITLSTQAATVVAGSTVQLTATVRDAQNKIIPGAPVSWTAQDAMVASVNQIGVVTGVAAGSTQVTALIGSVSAAAQITVTPPKTGGGVINPPSSQLKSLVEEIIGPVALPPGAQFDSLRTLAETWSEYHWTAWRAKPSIAGVHNFNYYDFAALMYYLGALTGDSKWASRADSLAKEYCVYACKPGNMVQPHNWQPRGVEIYVRRTGDPVARAALDLYGTKLSRQLDGTATYNYIIGGSSPNMDNRQVGRSILSTLAAINSAGRSNLAPKLSLALKNLSAQQTRDGGARWTYLGSKDPIFLAAILVHALGDMERRAYADQLIDDMSSRWLDDAWKEATPTRNCQGLTRTTLPYYYGTSPSCYLHTLNGIYAVPFAQRYARTGNPAHLSQVMELIDGSLASETWDNVGKQFMEVARTLWAAGVVGRAQGY